jgi:hypothetical protein
MASSHWTRASTRRSCGPPRGPRAPDTRLQVPLDVLPFVPVLGCSLPETGRLSPLARGTESRHLFRLVVATKSGLQASSDGFTCISVKP